MRNNNAILTITGSDSTGGSGVQADIKTISALGGYAVSAITSITVQNTLGIQEFYDIPADIVAGQIEAIVNDVQPSVIKVGLIRSVDVLNVVVGVLRRYHPRHVVYDPIFVSSKGERLVSTDVVERIKTDLLPLCTIVVGQRMALHGQNNAYSSAIAFYLSQDLPVDESMQKAESYVNSHKPMLDGLSDRSSELYHDFISKVAAHFTTNSDVAFYADMMNVSPRYLAQVCKKIADKSPKQIIDEYLLAAIRQQLLSTSRTAQEIAFAFGFSSQPHFAKFFKKAMGCTPREYRLRNSAE
ncbi:MAG: bifunctional hydroxymethylpyrimidine kinase/phosphomethylpyrimidine kinase [Prevotella sp.]|uniref:bifunctional hydroxymethylpyrimidine kinase/phosphomethylpyrimidine kinase n=1 Tax=Prevotella sp. P3-122 TaxID=2024223 RepID=UPI000B964402|nr:bifunctional hydroxymethylpyrimidine kinase/phosphomethylpyrimidine kinase [Prevotella sp. P3-122]MCI6180892.1 bifunctional hydroxymethylpyrimidine kinase/phosphomethylpyrimidine kinase [Prevotella sp.]MCI6310481.1 bifunctional hydroxymethylpyrimidine kinase/phosphomethylpyrimidine kinase [Prevotella sp.]MCI6462863.1 bifunctional hydroxymethylpyrimidine kinase/phosphomethylpyrimidine kinase [Prevotella sp.]MCI6501010.1 bifunctional hydroxymethylpyrimidine kinase/phosphomethylpyrimidine kinas